MAPRRRQIPAPPGPAGTAWWWEQVSVFIKLRSSHPLILVKTRGEQATWVVNGEKEGGRLFQRLNRSIRSRVLLPVTAQWPLSPLSCSGRQAEHPLPATAIPGCCRGSAEEEEGEDVLAENTAAMVLNQTAHSSTSCLTNPKPKPAAHAQRRDDRSDPDTGSRRGDGGQDHAGCDTKHSPGLARGRQVSPPSASPGP